MLEDGLDGQVLKVGRIAVFVQDPLHDDPDLGPGTFAEGPVDRGTLADLGDEFGCDDPELVIA